MSQYRSLAQVGKEWVFRREEPFVSEDDRAAILLLSEVGGANIWRDYVSADFLFPDQFSREVWVNTHIQDTAEWESTWESDAAALPEAVLEYVGSWGVDTKVYFCCHSDLVLETTWGVFQRAWKAFLFLDSDAILIGRKKKQALQFCENGLVSLLQRPA
ncbi:DUF2947 family protein [Marinomonas ostreistagni]|uniref:DUF2947 family protein n=1 Tax=Marinomonas ostreistagni TaxID=359209 RepID=UPI0019527F1A|nr:DUF2947 family protein [Marinomonas ostreistagni]MBM6550336.1 DUF2947 family protein [Marinomonas ostreistagni]